MDIDRNFLHRLRMLALVEGVSTLILFFVAMPMKYLAGMPEVVTVVGLIHGVLFMLLAAAFVAGIRKIPISRRLALAGITGAVVPFGPFVVDRWLVKVCK